MEYKPEELIIKQGLDEEDLLLFWPISEWTSALALLGVFIILRHMLIGLCVFLLSLYLFQKFRSEERGSKLHTLWRLNLWKSKNSFNWAPPAHATRFDN